MPVRVIDANAHLRQKLERDTSGLTLRTIAAEARDGDVFVWDGSRALEWRRAIYPRYKERREPAAENVYAALDLLRQVLLHTPALQVRVPFFEADDAIAAVVRRCAPCEVLTCDFDLKALETYEGVKVRCPYPKKVPPSLGPKDVRLWKTLVGDPSDRIAGVPGFGPVAWGLEIHGAWRELIGDLEAGREPAWEHLPIAPRYLTWARDHRDELLAMWNVVGLADLPDDLIDNCTAAGVPDPAAVDRLLREYLQ